MTSSTSPPDEQFEPDGTYAWRRMVVSVLYSIIGGAGMWSVVVVLPAVQLEFGVDRADASLPYTATMIFFGLGNLFIGRLIDRFGYWRPAMGASLLLSAGFALASQSSSIATFAVCQVLIGIGSAAMFGPLIADLSLWFERYRGIAVAAAASGNYLAGAFWPALIPHFMEVSGWRGAYLAIASICAVTLVPLVLLLRRRAPIVTAGSGRKRHVKPIALSPRALQALLVLAGFACCVAMSMPQVHIVAYCMDLGYGVARGSEMLAIMLAAGVVSRIASGFAADHFGGIPTLLVGSVLQGLSLLLYIPFDGLTSLYVVSFIFGLSQGGIVPCYAVIVREHMPASEAGARVGLVMMSTTFGMAFGGWGSGWVYDQTGSYAAAFLNGIAWNLVNLMVVLLVLSRSGRLRRAEARQ